MKKSVIEIIISVFINAFFIFVLNVITSFIAAEKGGVKISDCYKVENEYLINIELINYSNNYINDICLKIPSSTEIKNEQFISTLLLEKEQTNSQEFILYKINQLQPVSSSVIVLKQNNENDYIEFTNLKEKRFFLERKGRIESPRFKLFKQLLPTAILYIIIYSIVEYITYRYINKKQEELDKYIKKSDEKTIELQEELKQSKKEIDAVDKRLHTINFYYKKRLSDYSKENEFWRNTIRQLLYNGDKKFKKAEQLFDIITQQLQTYTIKSKSHIDLDEVIFLADELENDKNNTKK